MIENNNQQVIKKSPPHLIFSLMTLTNILINLDHGILPACTNQLKQTYDMSDTQLGFLGSIVYLGIVIMGTFAGQFYLRFNSKMLTIIAFVALEASLLFFVLSQNKILAYFCRFFTGICQVFLLVFYPVWIDKFGEKSKTFWLTLLQICVPVGIFAGYGITSLIVGFDLSFRWSFFIQISLVALFLIIFIIIPKQKLDAKRADQQISEDSFGSEIKTPLTENLIPSQQYLYNTAIKQNNKKIIKHSWVHNMKRLLKSKLYIIGTLTMSVILFVSTGIQFWLTDYFVNVLHSDPTAVYIAYAVVSITGPTSGCGFGGYVISKIGGYQSPKTIFVVFLFSAIGIGSAVVLPFIEQFFIDAVLLWLILFFGGSMMPGLTGLMMSSVPAHLRAFGNSNGQIIKNIFGYLPAPFFYGWFNQLLDSQRAGLRLIMFWGLFAPLLLGIGSFLQYRKQKKKQEKIRKRNLEKPSLIVVEDEPHGVSSSQQIESQTSQYEQEDSLQKNKESFEKIAQQKIYPITTQEIQNQKIQTDELKEQLQVKLALPEQQQQEQKKNEAESEQNKQQKNTSDQLNKRISDDDIQ